MIRAFRYFLVLFLTPWGRGRLSLSPRQHPRGQIRCKNLQVAGQRSGELGVVTRSHRAGGGERQVARPHPETSLFQRTDTSLSMQMRAAVLHALSRAECVRLSDAARIRSLTAPPCLTADARLAIAAGLVGAHRFRHTLRQSSAAATGLYVRSGAVPRALTVCHAGADPAQPGRRGWLGGWSAESAHARG